ncbi:unnamed protein product [Durusdinium trenchii]|uniref:Uncharacterized protein n=1 Tax=Durusdinium trenchii TaxID=1381693 RepID=A0ABP0HC48_9DINO
MSWWQDGKKKKKDKKKKEKKEKQESEASAEGPAEPDQVEVWQESFETMPSVGTWLMSFTEEDLLRPTTVVSSPHSVGESFFSATAGAEASVADALLAMAFGDLLPEAVEEIAELVDAGDPSGV